MTIQFLSGTSGVRRAASGGYHTDYGVVKTAIESSGIVLTTTQNSAGDRLIRDLHGETNPAYTTSDLWAKIKSLYPLLGGTADSHQYNWKDPRTFTAAAPLVYYNSPIHNANGISFNGVSQYIDTQTSVVGGNVSLGYYARTLSTTAGDVCMGTYDGSPPAQIVLQLNTNGSTLSFSSNQNPTYLVGTKTTGLIQGSSLNSRNALFSRGVLLDQAANSNSTVLSRSLYLGAMHNNPADPLTNAPCSFAYISDGLTDTECSVLNNVIQAYQTTLGRAVY